MTTSTPGPESVGDGSLPGPEQRRPSGPGGAAADADVVRRRESRRRRVDEIFGDVLPVTTDDERQPGERGGFDAEHYRANRPPHHVA